MEDNIDRNLLQYYANIMTEIKNRSDVIYLIYNKKITTKYIVTDVEFCALQLRKILELMLLSTLIANKKEYEKQSKDFNGNWQVKEKIKEIKKINPDFFPIAMLVIQSHTPSPNKKLTRVPISNDELFKESDFNKAYAFTNNYLHVQNPFGKSKIEDSPKDFYKKLIGYLKKILNLLSVHRVTLCNGVMLKYDIYSKRGDYTGVEVSVYKLADKSK